MNTAVKICCQRYCDSGGEHRRTSPLVLGSQGRAPGKGEELAKSPNWVGIKEVKTCFRSSRLKSLDFSEPQFLSVKGGNIRVLMISKT